MYNKLGQEKIFDIPAVVQIYKIEVTRNAFNISLVTLVLKFNYSFHTVTPPGSKVFVPTNIFALAVRFFNS